MPGARFFLRSHSPARACRIGSVRQPTSTNRSEDRFGSLATNLRCTRDVRCYPESDPNSDAPFGQDPGREQWGLESESGAHS